LIWTIVVAVVCWFIAINQIYALWKSVRDGSSRRRWSVAQRKITTSGLGVSPTHPSGLDPAEAGAMMRYHDRVGGKDYEGDGFRIGHKSRAVGLIVKATDQEIPRRPRSRRLLRPG
jgi:hypothetical protein